MTRDDIDLLHVAPCTNPAREPNAAALQKLRLSLNRLNRRHPFGTAGPSRLPQVMAGGAAPLDELIDAEERGRVRDGLGQLKPLDRAVLEAFYLRGLSLREISEEFDVPLGTVKRRLHTARQRLKEQLGPAPEAGG